MKNLLLFLLFFLTVTTINSQIVLKGVLTKNIGSDKKGDTINVYGFKKNLSPGFDKYYAKVSYEPRLVLASKIKLLDSNLNYWEKAWFNNNGIDNRKKGWETKIRKELNESALEYYFQAKNNDLIYKDELLYDYIYQLLMKIHPTKLIKESPTNLGLIIIKSNDLNYITFNNGYIALTTGLIAQTKNENELLVILTKCISHVVLEHNLINLRQQIKAERTAKIWGTVTTIASTAAMISSNKRKGTKFKAYDAINLGLTAYFLSGAVMKSIGANYSQIQNSAAIKISNTFLNKSSFDNILSEEEYTNRISDLISYTAWQEYNVMNYEYSISLINRILKLNLATEKDYLLLSKLYRVTAINKELILKAVDKIKKAKNIGISNLIELDKELGILYLRLKENEKAKESFYNYRNGLFEIEKQGFDISDELQFINQTLFKNIF